MTDAEYENFYREWKKSYIKNLYVWQTIFICRNNIKKGCCQCPLWDDEKECCFCEAQRGELTFPVYWEIDKLRKTG